MAEPHELTATETVAAIAAGKLTSEAVVRSCLERIDAREAVVKAWVTLDRSAALAKARLLDRGPRRGPLHGLPIGIKDIIETFDMPTTCGSPIYAGWQSNRDAAMVALCRDAGAVVLGKTVTTEFAWRSPGPTCNPHDPAHTPGGSSSGSAAAVADCMVHAAFGTQTAGSIVRPASYCGVVGFKPSYLAIPMAGVKPYSPSLDTLGPLTRTVRDAALIYSVAAADPEAAMLEAAKPKRIGLCRSPAWPAADLAMQRAFEEGARRLEVAGHKLVDCELPESMRDILAVHAVIMDWEGLGALAAERVANPDKLSAVMRETLSRSAGHGADAYQSALAKAARFRIDFDQTFEDVDLIVTPAATGEAPKGLDSTGQPAFNSPWTLLHAPCMSLPGMIGPNGLPIGLQAVGKRGDDKQLLSHALALEHVFRP